MPSSFLHLATLRVPPLIKYNKVVTKDPFLQSPRSSFSPSSTSLLKTARPHIHLHSCRTHISCHRRVLIEPPHARLTHTSPNASDASETRFLLIDSSTLARVHLRPIHTRRDQYFYSSNVDHRRPTLRDPLEEGRHRHCQNGDEQPQQKVGIRRRSTLVRQV